MNQPAPSSTASPDRFLRRSVRRLWRGGTWLCVLAFATHFTVRDRIPLVSLLFYASPFAVLGLVSVVWAVFGRFLDRSRTACTALALLGLSLLATAGYRDWRRAAPSPATPPRDTLRVLFWNVGRGWFATWDEVATEVRRFDADAIALSEATGDEVQEVAFWRRYLPGYACLPLGDGTVVLVRGTVEELESGGLDWLGLYRQTRVTVGNSRFQLVLTDVDSSLWRGRRRPLTRLGELMEQWHREPTLVVGDFNTPPTSVWFDPWRAKWRHAWEESGIGYRPTWPLPFPVLSLDHAWGNERIEFVRCFADWTEHSDHRPVVTEFRVKG